MIMTGSIKRILGFTRLFVPAIAMMFFLHMTATAQEAPPQSDAQEEEQGDETKRSLDELLGLEEDPGARSAREAAEAEAQRELERALNEQRISDAFKEAIAKMAVSAAMLGEEFDSGLGTQRVQEEIIRKLDLLIESARRQQSNSSASSASSSAQQQMQPQSARAQQRNQQQGDPSNQQRNSNPAQSSGANPPTQEQTADLNQMLEELDVEWGALPERTREQLLQATRDKTSSLYRRLTNEYFRRIAEGR